MTTDNSRPATGSDLTAGADNMVDEIDAVRGFARDWLSEAHHVHGDNDPRYAAAFETAKRIEFTAEAIRCVSAAFHDADRTESAVQDLMSEDPIVFQDMAGRWQLGEHSDPSPGADGDQIREQAQQLRDRFSLFEIEISALADATGQWIVTDAAREGRQVRPNDVIAVGHTLNEAETAARETTEQLTDIVGPYPHDPAVPAGERVSESITAAEHGLHLVRDHNTGLHQRECTDPTVDELATRSHEDAGAEHGRAAEIDAGHEPPS